MDQGEQHGDVFETWTLTGPDGVHRRTGPDGHPLDGNESFLSLEEIERHLLLLSRGSLVSERNHDVATQAAIITTFAVLIVFGALGNSLVCFVVARNARMRTPRNIFIINLAISDLTLCLFTQPFNLYRVLVTDWRLGSFLCKLVSMFAGTNVFVSTISITAIALDRFQVIVYPTRDSVKKLGAVVLLVVVWNVSFAMASPLLVFNMTAVFEPIPGITLYDVCVENPEMLLEKRIYSSASMVVQYLLPVLIVGVAHHRISSQLRHRLANNRRRQPLPPPQQTTEQTTEQTTDYHVTRNRREAQRKRKTNRLLVAITVVFAASWLPLNLFNLLADFDFRLTQEFDRRVGGLAFPVCHVLVLCSACVNPLLYGWLNDNFRREFTRVLCCCPTSGGGRGGGGGDASKCSGRHVTLETPHHPLTANKKEEEVR